jgi:acyl carrier protein
VTNDELRSTVLSAIAEIAPEVDPAAVDPSEPIQDEFDLDSMDFLRLMELLHERVGVEVPERDYPQVATLDACVDYLAAHAAA